jgi:lysophospholipid acyltransferase (LPLAT)-like uncharacterized protein
VKEVEQERPLTFKTWLLARVVGVLVRLFCGTLRLTIDREDECERLIREHNGAIFVTWHGRTMIPIHHWYRTRRPYHVLVSLSRDGDFLSELFRVFGMKVIRGSTGRRGVMATRAALAALDSGSVLGFTPDGPRGPSGVAQPGAVYFAQRSGRPIIPAGISAYPRWFTRSWDRFLIPRPFARARWVYGDPIFVGPNDDLEEACRRVTEAIRDLELRAEQAVVPEGAEVVVAGATSHERKDIARI